MVVENSYPDDPRVRKEAESLTDTREVTVIALRKKGEKWVETVGDVRVIRVPEFPDLGLGKLNYMIQYLFFTLITLAVFLVTHPLKHYNVLHVHNPPDTLFVLGLVGRLLGTKFIYDLHDLSPELYLSRFNGREDLIYRILLTFERWSCRTANVVITTNISYRDLIVGRHNLDPGRVFIVRNDPQIGEWKRIEEGQDKDADSDEEDDVKIGVYVGSINPQDGLDVLLGVVRKLVFERNRRDFVFHVLGSGDSLEDMKKMSADLGVQDHVCFEGFVKDRSRILDLMARAHVGVESAPDNPVNRLSTFIKIMEYMMSSTPIVAFDLPESRYSANGSAMLVPPGDLEGFADAVEALFDDKELRTEIAAGGKARVIEHLNWNEAAKVLLDAYASISPVK